MTRAGQIAAARARQDEPLDPTVLLYTARVEIDYWRLSDKARSAARAAARRFLTSPTATTTGRSLESVQMWWTGLERQLLKAHDADPGRQQAAAFRALMTSRTVRPSWALLSTV